MLAVGCSVWWNSTSNLNNKYDTVFKNQTILKNKEHYKYKHHVHYDYLFEILFGIVRLKLWTECSLMLKKSGNINNDWGTNSLIYFYPNYLEWYRPCLDLEHAIQVWRGWHWCKLTAHFISLPISSPPHPFQSESSSLCSRLAYSLIDLGGMK